MKVLLAIIEQGGYPDFSSLYTRLGFNATTMRTMRKAISFVKKNNPQVIVAEFNHQSDFRDRTSSLESLLATLEKLSQTQETVAKVVVFYEKEYEPQLKKLQAVFSNFVAMAYPISESDLEQVLP